MKKKFLSDSGKQVVALICPREKLDIMEVTPGGAAAESLQEQLRKRPMIYSARSG